tara:strand:+ start:870 stop:1205 length:336 start_codon:yes stop_codon:yes gene_type:complete
MKKENKIKKQNIPVSKGFGIAGFILSLIALLSLFVVSYVGIVLAILGLIFCIMQFKRGKTGLAIAGLVLSIITLSIGIIMIVAIVIIWQAVKNTIESGAGEIGQVAGNLGA